MSNEEEMVEQNIENINEKDKTDLDDIVFKLIIIGDQGVGKSCLAVKATKNFFEDIYAPTIGFEFLTYSLTIEDKNIKLQIWDTCGQEAYRSLINSFYRNSSLAILVYAINNRNSFDNLGDWLNEIRSQSNPDVKIILIGSKVDLEEERQITKEEGEKFCKLNKLNAFMETSAKTGFNAKNVFKEAAKILYEEKKNEKSNIEVVSGANLSRGSEPPIEEENGGEKRKRKGCPC